MAYPRVKKKDKLIEEDGIIAAWKSEFKQIVMDSVRAGCTKKELQEKVLESFLDYCAKVDISGEDMVEMVMKIAPCKEDIKESDLGAPVSYATFAKSIIRDRDDKVASDCTIPASEMLERAKSEKLSGQTVTPYKPGSDVTYPTGTVFDAKEEAKKVGFTEEVRPPDDQDEFNRTMKKFTSKEIIEGVKKHQKDLDERLMRVRAAAKKGGMYKDIRDSLRFDGRSYIELGKSNGEPQYKDFEEE